MKRIYLLLALLCPLLSKAQSFTHQDLTQDTLQTVDEVLANVDLSQVPSGLLLDKSFPFANPTLFDGVHLDSSNLIDFDTFGYLYATLYGASVDAASVPPHPNAYMNAADTFDNGGTLGIAVARFAYDFLSDAIDNNLLDTLNNRLYDVPNRPSSPYIGGETFFASPVTERIVGPTVDFRFDTSLTFSNMPGTVANLNVDFGDGSGSVTMLPGTVHTVTYGTEGFVTLLITANYADGTVRSAHATVEILADPGSRYTDGPEFSPNETFESNGDVLNVEIITACEDGIIRKPLIYVMGYNIGEGEKKKLFDNMTDIFLFINASEITGNEVGIYLEGGTQIEGLDWGLLTMSCTDLMNNDYGIAGHDVVLEVDAYQLAGHGNEPKSNHFAASETDFLFATSGDQVGVPSFVDIEYTRAQCRHYRDVARVFANAAGATDNFRLPAGTTTAEALDHLWLAGARGADGTATEAVHLTVSPNPASSEVRLTTNRAGTADYRCHDQLGRMVATGTFERQTNVVTRDWLPGVYTVEVRYPDQRMRSERVVIAR